MVDGKKLTEELITYSKEFLHMKPLDETYYRNALLREFRIDEPLTDYCTEWVKELTVPDVLVEKTELYAAENGLVSPGREKLFSTYIMGLLSPLPSEINAKFAEIRKESGAEKACDYFYETSVRNNYVQKTAIERNMKWEYADGGNVLEITVNLSKPEKDNKETAKLLSAPKKLNYPACLLCKENEGFEGTAAHPARENLRVVSLKMGGEEWFVQYSPYAYYEEHCIAINKKHIPMNVNAHSMNKLLDFVDAFPNYMIGSNASLPIVGGSILNHEHYQGGKHIMPMQKAAVTRFFVSEGYPNVTVGLPDWYNSVIRLVSKDRAALAGLGGELIENWKKYTNAECGIFCETDGTPHNATSPICRKLPDGSYCADFILRNNLTSEEYPDGIFHAHPEYHNIKKEAIGLIEAMGLFILPGRLKKQLAETAKILCGETPYSEAELSDVHNALYVHREMIKDLRQKYSPQSYAEAESVVRNRVGEICKNILLNTAVFKKDETGERGFMDFLNKNNIRVNGGN